ncbi:MAG: glutamate 5-kinase [Pseudomonadota bacterium]
MSGLANAKRIVVKIGSSLLTDPLTGTARAPRFVLIAEQIAKFRRAGCEVALVSSGAVSLGRRALGLPAGVLSLEQKQAAAAAGQLRLVETWREAFDPHAVVLAQALVTWEDTESRRRWLNARGTLNALLACGALPVINENDTVATEELRFGDNDRLAARVAAMLDADTLVLLSDVAGLCTADPSRDVSAQLIERIEAITPEIEALAGGTGAAGTGSGGMRSKIEAARIASQAGCRTVIAAGDVEAPLTRLMKPGGASWFDARVERPKARAAFIQGALSPQGALVLDEGAAKAVAQGRNLLPAGVTAVRGGFQRGDAVRLIAPDGTLIGKGLVAYDAQDASRILGAKSGEIEARLGYRRGAALVHAGDMVLEGR